MKQILLISTLLAFQLQAQSVSLVNQSTSSAWVDQKVEEIKPARKGLASSYLKTLRSPFIVVRPPEDSSKKAAVKTENKASLQPTKKDMSKEPLTLQMVLNSKALINGKWLKEQETFRGLKVIQISSNYVVMERKNKKVKLFIAQKNKNINISTK